MTILYHALKAEGLNDKEILSFLELQRGGASDSMKELMDETKNHISKKGKRGKDIQSPEEYNIPKPEYEIPTLEQTRKRLEREKRELEKQKQTIEHQENLKFKKSILKHGRNRLKKKELHDEHNFQQKLTEKQEKVHDLSHEKDVKETFRYLKEVFVGMKRIQKTLHSNQKKKKSGDLLPDSYHLHFENIKSEHKAIFLDLQELNMRPYKKGKSEEKLEILAKRAIILDDDIYKLNKKLNSVLTPSYKYKGKKGKGKRVRFDL